MIKEGILQVVREKIKEKKRQEFFRQVKEYYHPEPKSEEELQEIELDKHKDYLKRLKERHERGY
jgi:hypothetical protein